MENYLTAHGISRERLVLEEKSTNTKENLKFSDALTGWSQKNTGILSNNFHVYRAVKIAEKAGYEHPYGIASLIRPNHAGSLCGAGSSGSYKGENLWEYLKVEMIILLVRHL